MRAIILRQPAGLDQLEATTISDIGAPGPGQIAVRLKASSLNYHDYVVVTGATKTGDRRIPMSDGAGEVVAVGEGVTAFAPCDRVVSTFFINRLAGGPIADGLIPGDGIDGYAREAVVAPETSFSHSPTGYDHREAATLTCAGLTAWRALLPMGRYWPDKARWCRALAASRSSHCNSPRQWARRSSPPPPRRQSSNGCRGWVLTI